MLSFPLPTRPPRAPPPLLPWCADKEEVQIQLFIMSVEGYLREFLKLEDAVVSALLTPENSAALHAQLDHDKDGKVGPWLVLPGPHPLPRALGD